MIRETTFTKYNRSDKRFNNRGYSLLVLMNLFKSSRSEVFCKKRVLTISQNLQQKTCAYELQLYLKRESVTGV